MADLRYQENFFFAESADGLRQSAHDVPMDNADIDKLSPLTNPTTPTRQRTRRQVLNCNGTRIYKEPITSEYDSWTVGNEATPFQIARALAFIKGATTSPTGSPANEVQTITQADADGGAAAWAFAFEGVTGTTPALAWNITAANLKTALEKLESIGKGNITSITGTLATGFVVTFGGDLAKANVPLLSVGVGLTDGGSPVAAGVVQTTSGANKYHLITDSVTPVLAEESFYTGFDDDPDTFEKHKNAVHVRASVTIERRGISTLEREIIASSETEFDQAFTVPDCVIEDPAEAEDIKIKWGGTFIEEDIESISFEFNNNVPTDEKNLFPWKGRNITQPTKGRQPSESVTISIQGSKTDQIYLDADAEGEGGTEKELVLYIGKPGERVVITYPKMSLKLNGGITFDQTSGKSIFSMNGQPHDDSGLGAYSKVEYFGAATTQILST